MQDFGPLLKLLRTNAGYTQQTFAQLLNSSVSNVSKWERSISIPDIVSIREISHILNISCDELFHPTETLTKLNSQQDICKSFSITKPADSTKTESSPPEETHNTTLSNCSLPKYGIVFISLLILLLAFSIITILYRRNILTPAEPYTFVEARTNIDSTYGNIHELVYYINTETSDIEMQQYADSLAINWRSGKYENNSESYFSVAFYQPTDNIANWNLAYFRSIYFK